jgi:hypothetical protein
MLLGLTNEARFEDLEACENVILTQWVTFWTLPITCFLFKNNISEIELCLCP